VRAGNFSPGAAPLDAFLEPTGTGTLVVAQVGQNLGPGNLGTYSIVRPGAYRASFPLTGQTTEIVGDDLAFPAGASSSLYVVGLAGGTGTQALRVIRTVDDLAAPPAGQAKLRALQLAPSEQAIDLVSLDGNGAITKTLVANLAYPGASTYVNLAPGSYLLDAVPTGTTTLLLPSSAAVSLSVSAGSVYSAVLCQATVAGACAAGGTTLGIFTAQDH